MHATLDAQPSRIRKSLQEDPSGRNRFSLNEENEDGKPASHQQSGANDPYHLSQFPPGHEGLIPWKYTTREFGLKTHRDAPRIIISPRRMASLITTCYMRQTTL
jgi:hypothetical protein